MYIYIYIYMYIHIYTYIYVYYTSVDPKYYFERVMNALCRFRLAYFLTYLLTHLLTCLLTGVFPNRRAHKCSCKWKSPKVL